jgi:hypothetical protein
MIPLRWCGKKVSRLKFAYFSWLARRLPTCIEILPVISQNLDGRLPITEKVKLILHKHFCEWCKRYENQLILIRKAMRNQDANAPVSSESPLSSEARERMKRFLNQQ